jgi:predicted lipoprotein with Yx(FWY)xxD motif
VNGLTLYNLSTEDTGKNVCAKIKGCLGFWPPLTVAKGVKPTGAKGLHGTFGVIKRAGVGRLVTYDGWALYMFKGDTKPGQTNGNGINAPFGDWRAVHAAPMVRFTVNITTTPPTWGTVSVKYTYAGIRSAPAAAAPAVRIWCMPAPRSV